MLGLYYSSVVVKQVWKEEDLIVFSLHCGVFLPLDVSYFMQNLYGKVIFISLAFLAFIYH